MDKQESDCIVKLSKAGKNLFARVPDEHRAAFGRGDKVKIVVIEKSLIKDEAKIKKELKEFLKKPNGEKLKGTILGYPVEIPLAKIIRNMGSVKAEKLLYEALTN